MIGAFVCSKTTISWQSGCCDAATSNAYSFSSMKILFILQHGLHMNNHTHYLFADFQPSNQVHLVFPAAWKRSVLAMTAKATISISQMDRVRITTSKHLEYYHRMIWGTERSSTTLKSSEPYHYDPVRHSSLRALKAHQRQSIRVDFSQDSFL